MSFERLTSAVDRWASEHSQHSFFAQIGPTASPPENMPWKRLLPGGEFKQKVDEADIVVAHAGMGSILSALLLRKPIVVMPRRGDLRETRNDHQLATADRLSKLLYVSVATDTDELYRFLESPNRIVVGEEISPYASEQLLGNIRDFISEC